MGNMTQEQLSRLANEPDRHDLALMTAQQLADRSTPDESIPLVLHSLCDAYDADCARVYAVWSGDSPSAYSAGRHTVHEAADEHLLALVAAYGDIVYVAGAATDYDSSALPHGYDVLVALPLSSREMLRGVMWLGFEQPRDLGDADITLLATVGAQIAAALGYARAYDAVRQQYEWLESILAHTPDPVLVVDAKLRLKLANPAAKALFAALNDDVLDLALHEIAQVDALIPLMQADDSQDDADTDDDDGPLEYTTDDGRTFTVSMSEVAIMRDGERGWVLVLQDVTRFKRLHDNMSDFLATVSHDMRSPLTFMRGYLDMLDMVGPLNERQDEYTNRIATGFDQMSDMVDKILKAGRLDPMTGTYRLEREPCDVIDMVDEVVNNLASPAHAKKLILRRAVDDGIPILNLDRGLVVSAFMNLAENAVKYTPEGGTIEITLYIEDNDLMFRVTDDGYGISAEDQQKLFRRNVRIHRKEWKRVKGSGLGLFIVKNVAQRHGGDTWVDSMEGKGSTFYFSIPLDGPNLLSSESRDGRG